MTEVRVITKIAAPIERCFDLARSVEAHVDSARDTGERVVAGRTSGLLELGDQVTWSGRHLGVRQQLSGGITRIERPTFFQDRMSRGAFKSMEHDHHFEATDDGGTLMTDVLRFAAPFGPIGWVVERLVLAGHLRRFLERRNAILKRVAESEEWRSYLHDR